jgi:hypothetical protein
MFFQFNDPDQLKQVLEQVKISLENAATAPSPAQLQFKKLSAQFNTVAGPLQSFLQNPQQQDPMVLMMVAPALMGLKNTFQQIQQMAQTDRQVRSALDDLRRDIADRTKPFLKDMPSFPGLPGMPDFGGGQDGSGPQDGDQPKDNRPKKPKPPSDSGDYQL